MTFKEKIHIVVYDRNIHVFPTDTVESRECGFCVATISIPWWPKPSLGWFSQAPLNINVEYFFHHTFYIFQVFTMFFATLINAFLTHTAFYFVSCIMCCTKYFSDACRKSYNWVYMINPCIRFVNFTYSI